jgi:hypothetical protein
MKELSTSVSTSWKTSFSLVADIQSTPAGIF